MTSKSIHLVFVALTLAACMDTEPVAVDEAPIDETSACACETSDCVADWVKDTLGCGICIDLQCADGRTVGACVVCPSAPRENVRVGSIAR